jgi:hypothetical protein
MQLRYLYLSQLFGYWLRRESEMSDGKETRRVRTSLKYPYPSQLQRSIPPIGPTDRRGYSDIPLVALASRLQGIDLPF